MLNILVGTQKFPRKGSNWPAMPDSPDESQWKADQQLIRDIHQKLRAAVEVIEPTKLDDVKTIRLILGAAAHDAYHTGQISAMKKMLAGKK